MLEPMGIIRCACPGPAVFRESTWVRIGSCLLLEIGKWAKCMPGLNQSNLSCILKIRFIYESWPTRSLCKNETKIISGPSPLQIQPTTANLRQAFSFFLPHCQLCLLHSLWYVKDFMTYVNEMPPPHLFFLTSSCPYINQNSFIFIFLETCCYHCNSEQ